MLADRFDQHRVGGAANCGLFPSNHGAFGFSLDQPAAPLAWKRLSSFRVALPPRSSSLSNSSSWRSEMGSSGMDLLEKCYEGALFRLAEAALR